MALNGTNRVELRRRLPNDVAEHSNYLADAIDDLRRDVVAELSPGLQVIITEHAEPTEEWYRAAVVERWRNGAALIPATWIADSEPPGGGEDAE